MSVYFDSWSGFLVMEGHGFYVWSAYAVAATVVAYNLIAPFIAKRRVIAQVRRQKRLVKRKEAVNEFKITIGSGDGAAQRLANSGNTKHRTERQKESLGSVERSAQ